MNQRSPRRLLYGDVYSETALFANAISLAASVATRRRRARSETVILRHSQTSDIRPEKFRKPRTTPFYRSGRPYALPGPRYGTPDASTGHRDSPSITSSHLLWTISPVRWFGARGPAAGPHTTRLRRFPSNGVRLLPIRGRSSWWHRADCRTENRSPELRH